MKMMGWYTFFDMSSGGYTKTPYDLVIVEAPSEDDARERFTCDTGREPSHITCHCCGQDYSVSGPYETESEALAGYERFVRRSMPMPAGGA